MIKIKRYTLSVMLALAVWFAPFSPFAGNREFNLGVQQAIAAETGDIANVQLMLKKLREMLASLKDMDELSRAGMPKSDVERMKSAMRKKINKMVDETIAKIQKL